MHKHMNMMHEYIIHTCCSKSQAVQGDAAMQHLTHKPRLCSWLNHQVSCKREASRTWLRAALTKPQHMLSQPIARVSIGSLSILSSCQPRRLCMWRQAVQHTVCHAACGSLQHLAGPGLHAAPAPWLPGLQPLLIRLLSGQDAWVPA